MKKVFVSYSHRQGEWVWDRLVPVLRAAGCQEVFVDVEHFAAGQGVIGQLDSCQDQADVSLLVLSPEYLASDSCRHEMERAMAADPDYRLGRVLPVMRIECDRSALDGPTDKPIVVDMVDDRQEGAWAQVLGALGADRLGTSAMHWLEVRDEVRRVLGERRECLNLVVRDGANWRCLIAQLKKDLGDLAEVDLDHPRAITREGLVESVLRALGHAQAVGPPPRDLLALDALCHHTPAAMLAITNCDDFASPARDYTVELSNSLRHYASQGHLALLTVSKQPLVELLPTNHPLSRLCLHSVRLG